HFLSREAFLRSTNVLQHELPVPGHRRHRSDDRTPREKGRHRTRRQCQARYLQHRFPAPRCRERGPACKLKGFASLKHGLCPPIRICRKDAPGSAALRLETEETVPGSDVQHAAAGKFDAIKKRRRLAFMLNRRLLTRSNHASAEVDGMKP